MWILYVVFFNLVSHGVAITSIPFHSKDACEKAAAQISRVGQQTYCLEDPLPKGDTK
jgi:hypothetical protein